MKRFFWILLNLCSIVLGKEILAMSYSIREFFSSLEFDVVIASFGWVITSVVALSGMALILTSAVVLADTVISYMTEFSIIAYALKKFGIEETDN